MTRGRSRSEWGRLFSNASGTDSLSDRYKEAATDFYRSMKTKHVRNLVAAAALDQSVTSGLSAVSAIANPMEGTYEEAVEALDKWNTQLDEANRVNGELMRRYEEAESHVSLIPFIVRLL